MGLLRKAISVEYPEHTQVDTTESSQGEQIAEADFSETETHIEAEDAVEEFSLDEMGIALKERISRLKDESGTPYTVLSLLKAYGNFQSALCLALNNGAYSVIASLGIFRENILIPIESIWSSENAKLPFFRLEAEKKQEFSLSEEDSDYWIIPLSAPGASCLEPWKGLMILGVSGNSDAHTIFDAQSIAAITSGNEGKILLKQYFEKKKESIQDADEEDTSASSMGKDFPLENFSIGQNSSAYNSIQDKISNYHQSHGEFNCIILEIPESAGEEEKVHFNENVIHMIGMAGNVIDLSSGCPLILLPREADRELIAHRLSSSLHSRTIMSFKTNSPESACENIHSLL